MPVASPGPFLTGTRSCRIRRMAFALGVWKLQVPSGATLRSTPVPNYCWAGPLIRWETREISSVLLHPILAFLLSVSGANGKDGRSETALPASTKLVEAGVSGQAHAHI